MTRQSIGDLLISMAGLAYVIGALVVGVPGVATWVTILVAGINAVWRDFTQGPDRMNGWLVLLCTVGAAYVVGWPIYAFAKRQERHARYDELYAVATRLKEASQKLQDVTARGSRGEVISAELHWLDAVADLEALRPPSSTSGSSWMSAENASLVFLVLVGVLTVLTALTMLVLAGVAWLRR